MEKLLSARQCSRPWDYNGEQDRQNARSLGALILVSGGSEPGDGEQNVPRCRGLHRN